MKLVKKVIGSPNFSGAIDSQKITATNTHIDNTRPPGGPLNIVGKDRQIEGGS